MRKIRMKGTAQTFRNWLTATLCASLVSSGAFAQATGKQEKRHDWHEAGASIGLGSQPRGGMDIPGWWGVTASYTAHYFYHLDKRWAVGLQGGYRSDSGPEWEGDPLDCVYQGTNEARSETPAYYYTSDIGHHTYSLLPIAKFTWVDGRRCRCYTKAGVGGYMQRQRFQHDYYASEDEHNHHTPYSTDTRHQAIWRAVWQVTPVGLELGTQRMCFFTEWQFGTLPALNFGLVYRFGKKNGL